MSEGKMSQHFLGLLKVDDRAFDVYELRTGDEVEGYDVYEILEDHESIENPHINPGAMLTERPTVESLREYLKQNEPPIDPHSLRELTG